MALEVILRPQARRDLTALYDYICAQRGESTVASAYVRRIRRFINTLAVTPERGRLRPDILPGLRIIGFERRVNIAFIVEPDRVVIGRVLYGGRSPEAIATDNPF